MSMAWIGNTADGEGVRRAVKLLGKLWLLAAAVCCSWALATAGLAAPVAVFPLQELGDGRNEVNLPLTRLLSQQLADSGNDLVAERTVMAFMANNRIRTLGHLDTYHVAQVRSDLGAAFVLLGTVSQRRERPEPSLGLTLNLVRTRDARTVWSYVDSLSTSDERRVLGIGEPQGVAELQPLLLAEMMKHWPWHIINQVEPQDTLHIDLVRLEPRHVRPGETLHCMVRLRDSWPAGLAPRGFFRADEQLYPATLAADGRTFEGTWVAGSTSGNYPVTLLLEWPHYGRSETALLGSYLVDSTPPLLELELRGGQQLDGRQVFNQRVQILPRMLVRKPLSHWKLSFFSEGGVLAGDMTGEGQLPNGFVWAGRANYGVVEDGTFQVVLEVWDKAGNSARADQWLEINRSVPRVTMAVDSGSAGVQVDLANEGKVPLEVWRMEMWTSEGRILAREEGQALPVKISLDLAGEALSPDTQGFVFVQDVLGNVSRRDIKELLPNLGGADETPTEAPASVSESWVDEF